MTMTPDIAMMRVGRLIRELELGLDQLVKQGGSLLGEMVDAQDVLDLRFDEAQIAFMRVTESLNGLTNVRKSVVMAHGAMHKIAETRSDIVWPSENIDVNTVNKAPSVEAFESEQLAA